MRLLVLGGTHHVGRAVVEAALSRGDDVTTLTRGVTGTPPEGVYAVHADRTDTTALRDALSDAEFDAVIDTWSGPPRVVRQSAALLAGRAGHYGYVSSRSVYQWPFPAGMDESAPVVPGSADDPAADDYPAAKRGGELAVLESFGDNALLARAGLILGPYEETGRLPWWLTRLARGGQVAAPGPPSRPLQYIDARDLASWMLAAAQRGLGGAFNIVSRPGHTNMADLLAAAAKETDAAAELVWVTPEAIAAADIRPWTELPIWTPPSGELASMHATDVTAAHREGLSCRPAEATVADTWKWLRTEGMPPWSNPSVGLDPAKEQALLLSR